MYLRNFIESDLTIVCTHNIKTVTVKVRHHPALDMISFNWFYASVTLLDTIMTSSTYMVTSILKILFYES